MENNWVPASQFLGRGGEYEERGESKNCPDTPGERDP